MPERKPRSFNALKFVNDLRVKNGLHKVSTKLKPVKISKEEKEAIIAKIIKEKFGELLAANLEILSADVQKKLELEFKAVEGQIRDRKISTKDFLGSDYHSKPEQKDKPKVQAPKKPSKPSVAKKPVTNTVTGKPSEKNN